MSSFELFHSYRRGWVDAAKSAARDPKFIEHKTRPDLTAQYERGYLDGRHDSDVAMKAEAERVSYVANILREDEPPPVPTESYKLGFLRGTEKLAEVERERDEALSQSATAKNYVRVTTERNVARRQVEKLRVALFEAHELLTDLVENDHELDRDRAGLVIQEANEALAETNEDATA